MSKLARELLERWTAENAKAVPAAKRREEAARLALRFRTYADDSGIGESELAELEEDMAEDFETFMLTALEEAGGVGDET